MKKFLFVIFAAALLVTIALAYKYPAKAPAPIVGSFEECAAAGYPVMESYPRQCRDAKGNLFMDIISE